MEPDHGNGPSSGQQRQLPGQGHSVSGCLCRNTHIVLRGRRRIQHVQKFESATKVAQAYQADFCTAYAKTAGQSRATGAGLEAISRIQPSTDQFAGECKSVAPAGEQKGVLGPACPVMPRRQQLTAGKAVAVGHQMRHGRLPPVIPPELDPGRAVQHLLGAEDPFDTDANLTPGVQHIAEAVADQPTAVQTLRSGKRATRRQRADEPKVASLMETLAITDPHLKRFFSHADPSISPDRRFGSLVRLAWWRDAAVASGVHDRGCVEQFRAGVRAMDRVLMSGARPELPE